MSTTVLVTGATGYIAQHVIKNLLDDGYTVIGTVRSVSKAAKLVKSFNNDRFKLETVKDIAAPGAFDDIFRTHGKEIKVVLHTASPFFFDSDDFDKDLLKPAVAGTTSILEAIKKFAPDVVERVVVTSSHAATCTIEEDSEKGRVIDERSWNNMPWNEAKQNGMDAYCASKAFAEKAAWDFYKKNKDSVKFELTTVNPVFVFGPQLFDWSVQKKLNTSCELINQVVHSTPDIPVEQSLCGLFIDVRDVAKAHKAAFEKEACVGQRLLLSNGRFTLQSVADIINSDFPSLRGHISRGIPGGDKTVIDKRATLENFKTREILGYQFITLKQTVDDTVSQILRVEGRV